MSFTTSVKQSGACETTDPIGFTLEANCTTGRLLVLFLVYSNVNDDGSDVIDGGSSMTDTQGNTWTTGENVSNSLFTGAFSQVIVRSFYTWQNIAALSIGDAISVSGQHGDNGHYPLYILYEAGATYPITFKASGNSSGNGLYPTITTTSLATNDILFAISGVKPDYEYPANYDSDSSNGSWINGDKKYDAGVVPLQFISQYKVISGTGAQTFNPTFTNDGSESTPPEGTIYLAFTENVPASSGYGMSMMGVGAM